MLHAYDELPPTPANFVPLSPLSYLARTAMIYPNRTAIIHGERHLSWQQTDARCRQFADQLTKLGIGKNDTVSTLLPNVPAMLEAHFAVPMTGAVLNTINTRLDANTIAFILQHAESKVLLVDPEFAPVARDALAQLAQAALKKDSAEQNNSEQSSAKQSIVVIDVADSEWQGADERISELEYESWIAQGNPEFDWQLPSDEWNAISLNYTSGTTGNPKGVVYHHRGAYLNAASNLLAWGMPPHSTYLWTLPLFHCNGWCFPWSMAANAGTSVCLRKVEPVKIFELIARYNVGYFCGAPIVHNMLINTPEHERVPVSHQVQAMVAGAAPPAAIIEGMARLGFNITHTYGLTETYGPAALCAKQDDWAALDIAGQAERNSRQGVPYHLQDAMRVLDPQTMQPVPNDGQTLGEIMFRGNIVMKGYLKNPKATAEVFASGWFHSGDLAVAHSDGYAKITDRSKDVIISGGENISSLEVEEALYRHPAILTAAVVAKPDDKWQEVPCAFVELKKGHEHTSTDELLAHCKQHLARFKVPKDIIVTEIPKTSTGKLQKFVLRDWLKQGKTSA